MTEVILRRFGHKACTVNPPRNFFARLPVHSWGRAASRLLASIVYQATASDPLVILAVAVGLIAAALPARRALSINPARLLRDE